MVGRWQLVGEGSLALRDEPLPQQLTHLTSPRPTRTLDMPMSARRSSLGDNAAVYFHQGANLATHDMAARHEYSTRTTHRPLRGQPTVATKTTTKPFPIGRYIPGSASASAASASSPASLDALVETKAAKSSAVRPPEYSSGSALPAAKYLMVG